MMYNIIEADKRVFQSFNKSTEGVMGVLIEKIEYPDTGGSLVWFKNRPYPQKIILKPLACHAVFYTKRLFAEQIRFFTSKPVVYFVGLAMFLLPKKAFYKIALNYCQSIFETINRILREYYIKPQYHCKSALEWYRVLSGKFEGSRVWQRFGAWFCMIWEFDVAYRYRGQDIIPEINKEAFFKDYKKEIRRVVGIMLKREECDEVKEKVNRMITALLFLMERRKWIKDQVFHIVRMLDLEKIRFDEGDKYWVAPRIEYKYNGLTAEKRLKLWRIVK